MYYEKVEDERLFEVFVEMIDELGRHVITDVGDALLNLAKKFPAEAITLLSEIAKRSKNSETREYVIDIISNIAVEHLKPTEKPEEPETSEIGHGEEGTT